MLTLGSQTSGRNTPAAGKVVGHRRRFTQNAGPAVQGRRPSHPQGAVFSMVDQESGTYRPRRAFTEPDPEPAPSPTAAVPDFVDEDAPKPLYRDEYAPRPLYRDEPSVPGPEMSDDTAGRPITFVPRPRP